MDTIFFDGPLTDENREQLRRLAEAYNDLQNELLNLPASPERTLAVDHLEYSAFRAKKAALMDREA